MLGPFRVNQRSNITGAREERLIQGFLSGNQTPLSAEDPGAFSALASLIVVFWI